MFSDNENLVYKVVLNEEAQYSIWPADMSLPVGWSEEGNSGSKEQCLAHIDKVWVDMRPLSLRKKLGEA